MLPSAHPQKLVSLHSDKSSIRANDARYTREIKKRITLAKAAFNKAALFTSQLRLLFKEETSNVLHLEHSFVWCWNWTLENAREIPGNLLNVVPEKDLGGMR